MAFMRRLDDAKDSLAQDRKDITPIKAPNPRDHNMDSEAKMGEGKERDEKEQQSKEISISTTTSCSPHSPSYRERAGSIGNDGMESKASSLEYFPSNPSSPSHRERSSSTFLKDY